ncbi:MAG TPA: hypothetical protein VNA11_04175 [Pseudonocardia sp.]|nr:hypothetical protein [Pseudonocardia sp.]
MIVPANPYHVPVFFVRQKITLMVNRYEIRGATPDGREGQLLAFAQQKRLKFKEEVTFYTDESRRRAVFSFKARQGLDVGPSTTCSTSTASPWVGSRRSSGPACCAPPGG